MKYILIALLACLVSSTTGCTTGREIQLEERWRPLISVKEGTDKVLGEGITMTIAPHCYVPDLKTWVQDYPEGSVQRDALLLHEQIHAIRQLATGLSLWLPHYATNTAFRWQEESLGYELEFRHLAKHGMWIDEHGFAQAVSKDYKGLDGKMISYNDARQWVADLRDRIQRGQ